MNNPKVLFILKQRPHGPYGTWSHSPNGKPLESGLSISVGQMTIALDELGIANKVVQVVDNNSIDREVTRYKPTHVIIEAFWVVPEKFAVLHRLHPHVKWIVRNHSKCDFLSHEGGMVGWAIDYVKWGVTLACNSPEATADFKRLAHAHGADPEHVVYLPNYYSAPGPRHSRAEVLSAKLRRWFGYYGPRPHDTYHLMVGCFGAIRPLKNHLHQAMAAIEFAEKRKQPLRFYINSTRVEGKADPILTSMRQLFKRYPRHDLKEVGWMAHERFVLFASTMHLISQVSNSETFNIVAADAVAKGVPVVVSEEIPWLDREYHADPTSVVDIAERMEYVYRASGTGLLQDDQLIQLRTYARHSKELWRQYLQVGGGA